MIFLFMFVLCIRMMTLFPVSAMDFSSGVDYALRCLGSPEMRLKPEQIASIKGIYEGRDVFTWLPTGFGKSICYQVLPFLFDVKLCRNDSAILVVSPLVSLMIDQAQNLKSKGVDAAIMSTSAGFGESGRNLLASDTSLSNSKILYCSPEALQRGRWRESLRSPMLYTRIVCVVIDEAHCVSKW